MGDQRGQSPVLGIVLLVGFVVVAVSALLIVGSTALSSVQDQSEREHDLNEMQSVSHEIENAIQSSDSGSSMEVQNGYRVSDGATVTIWVDGEKAVDEEIRRLERNGFVYEGSMILEDGNVVSAPNFDLGIDSTKLQIPTVESSTGSFGGEIRHTGTQTIDSPEERLEIEVESEYYEQWYDQFKDANATVTKDDSRQTVYIDFASEEPEEVESSLNLGMSDGSDFDLNSIPETHIESYFGVEFGRHEAVVGTTADAGNMGAGRGYLSIQGMLRSEGDVDDFAGHQQTDITQGVESNVDVPRPTPTSELIVNPDTASSISVAEQYEEGDGDLEGGIYYTDGDLTLADVTVKDQTILVVDGDLTIDGAGVEVRDALDVHVHGELRLDSPTAVTTAAQYQAERVSLFVTEDIRVESQSTATGLIHATESTVDVDRESLTVYGVMSADDITGHHNHGTFNFYYDERLEGQSPYATSRIPGIHADPFVDYDGNVTSGDATFTYETISGDLLVEDDVDAEGATINGNLLSEGEMDLLRTDMEDLAARGDIDIEEGGVAGNFWTEGDANITRVEIDGNVFVDGDADIEGGTVRGDVYVTGDVDIRRAHVEGDLIAGNDITVTGGGIDGDIRTSGDLDLERADVEDEVHVMGALDFSDGSTGGSIFAGGDVDLTSADINNGNGDLHAAGDISCSGAAIDTIYAAPGSTVTCSAGTVGTGDPTEPQVPSDLPPSLNLPEPHIGNEKFHQFDIRIAGIEVE